MICTQSTSVARHGIRKASDWPWFAVSPHVSFSVRGERWFFVVRDTASFLGATGGRFGINHETTLGGGLFWDLGNVSAGLSLTEYSLPLCGPQRCGQVRGLAPGASVRLDLFGPYLSGGLGIAVDCAGTRITGSAAPVWSGVAVRCSAGPIKNLTLGIGALKQCMENTLSYTCSYCYCNGDVCTFIYAVLRSVWEIAPTPGERGASDARG